MKGNLNYLNVASWANFFRAAMFDVLEQILCANICITVEIPCRTLEYILSHIHVIIGVLCSNLAVIRDSCELGLKVGNFCFSDAGYPDRGYVARNHK